MVGRGGFWGGMVEIQNLFERRYVQKVSPDSLQGPGPKEGLPTCRSRRDCDCATMSKC